MPSGDGKRNDGEIKVAIAFMLMNLFLGCFAGSLVGGITGGMLGLIVGLIGWGVEGMGIGAATGAGIVGGIGMLGWVVFMATGFINLLRHR